MMKRVYIFIWELLKKYKYMQIVGLFLTITYSSLYFVCPMLSQILIDNITDQHPTENIIFLIFIFAVILMIQPLVQFAQKKIFIKMSEDISADLKEMVFSKTLHNNLAFFENKTKGEILSIHIDDTQKISVFVSDIFITIIKNILIVISIGIGMISYSVLITAIIIAILLVAITIINKYNYIVQSYSKEAKEKYDSNCSIINDVYYNIFIIKIYNLYDFCMKKFSKTVEDSKNTNVKLKNLSNRFNVFFEILTVGCICMIYVIGFLKVIKGRMTLGEVMALVLYFQMLLTPLLDLLNSNISFQTIVPYIDRIAEYTNSAQRKNITDNVAVNSSVINIKNLRFFYEPENIIFENVNLKIDEKQIIAIIGKSGSGKTTFLKLLLGLLQGKAGGIYLGDKLISSLDLTKYILMVPQNSKLFNMSILENIRCGDSSIKNSDIYQTCRDLDIYDDFMRLENGFDTVITEEMNISGGQAQRICIARAVVRKPSIIILDEPTSALDLKNIQKIIRVIKILKKQCTIIIVTHDSAVIDAADQVYAIKDRRIERYDLEQGE